MKEHGHSELGFIVAPQGSQLSTDLNIKNVTNEVEIKHYLPRMRLIQKHTNQAVRSFQPDVFNPHFAFYTTMVTRRAIPHVPIVTHFHGPWALETEVQQTKTATNAIKETKFWLKTS